MTPFEILVRFRGDTRDRIEVRMGPWEVFWTIGADLPPVTKRRSTRALALGNTVWRSVQGMVGTPVYTEVQKYVGQSDYI